MPDAFDNCIDVPNGPLAYCGHCDAQQDSDWDGYGNACDFDFNNNSQTDIVDCQDIIGQVTKPAVGHTQYDTNCNGAADLVDLFMALNNVGGSPGPSGLPCSAANEKGTCPPEL